jgi:hypothetical protein
MRGDSLECESDNFTAKTLSKFGCWSSVNLRISASSCLSFFLPGHLVSTFERIWKAYTLISGIVLRREGYSVQFQWQGGIDVVTERVRQINDTKVVC